MDIVQPREPASMKPLRLWLGVVAVVLILLRFGLPIVAPEAMLYAIFGGLIGAVAILLWWMFFSRAAWSERLGAVALMIVALLATSRIVDKSIATGMMGFMFPMYAIPVLSIAFAVWAIFGHRLPKGSRRASMAATILLACAAWALLRTNGIMGSGGSDLAWRWSKTREQRLLAEPRGQASELPAAIPEEHLVALHVKDQPAPVTPTPAPPPTANTNAPSWPGFRGSGRDGVVSGTRIETDWSTSPPVQLWRRPIGPGWSSFSVNGDRIYTQEQRGDDEIVACYNAATGNPVWAHRDAARFWESNAGAGPRATPTLHDGGIYTFGATGILNALDGATGAVIWSRNAAQDTNTTVPGWGFASSPLVIGDMLIVAVSGKLAAYDLASGAPRWVGPPGGDSYSSPHLATIEGVPQILLMSSRGASSVTPKDGTLLWKHPWRSGTRIMQPALTADGGLLISGGDAMGGEGIRRLAVAHGPNGWIAEERWTSAGLKSNFNDFVVYDGYVYGFNGAILACIDAKNGERKWKGGRYGAGQLILLRDQGVLLVLSEEGEIGLVKASPDGYTELARLPAIEGKTWNHPVLVDDRLLVRNDHEMAAFRLARR
jgi:outer membrane protein assembly factor BamB